MAKGQGGGGRSCICRPCTVLYSGYNPVFAIFSHFYTSLPIPISLWISLLLACLNIFPPCHVYASCLTSIGARTRDFDERQRRRSPVAYSGDWQLNSRRPKHKALRACVCITTLPVLCTG